MTNGLSHPYHLDESTFILGAAGVTFHFYFAFYYIYIGSGTARFITVETRMFPNRTMARLNPPVVVLDHLNNLLWVYTLCRGGSRHFLTEGVQLSFPEKINIFYGRPIFSRGGRGPSAFSYGNLYHL